ncbi:MAG: hypothetical protein GEV06_21170 [Luteitalea sp.]|nr:hypothetical protein [Luteitalea sp.]
MSGDDDRVGSGGTSHTLAAAGAPQRSVTVAVAVEHQDGRPVEGLTAADFSVSVDGHPIDLSKATYEAGAMSLVVLVDVTTSTFWPGDTSARSVADTIRNQVLTTLQDDAAVMVGSFGRSLRTDEGFSTDRTAQRRALMSVLNVPGEERTGPSPIWDVVHQLTDIEQIADHIVIIRRGQCVVEGAIDDVRQRWKRVRCVMEVPDAPLPAVAAGWRQEGRVLTGFSPHDATDLEAQLAGTGITVMDAEPATLKEIFFDQVKAS